MIVLVANLNSYLLASGRINRVARFYFWASNFSGPTPPAFGALPVPPARSCHLAAIKAGTPAGKLPIARFGTPQVADGALERLDCRCHTPSCMTVGRPTPVGAMKRSPIVAGTSRRGVVITGLLYAGVTLKE